LLAIAAYISLQTQIQAQIVCLPVEQNISQRIDPAVSNYIAHYCWRAPKLENTTEHPPGCK